MISIKIKNNDIIMKYNNTLYSTYQSQLIDDAVLPLFVSKLYGIPKILVPLIFCCTKSQLSLFFSVNRANHLQIQLYIIDVISFTPLSIPKTKHL